MEFLSAFYVVFHFVALSVVPFLLMFLVIVFVHEFGHFLAGLAVRAEIDSFSLGFGKEIFGFTSRSGVRFRICWIPFGGYVKFVGDADVSSRPDRKVLAGMDDARKSGLLAGKSAWQRIFVFAAGPAANFLFAFVVLTGYYRVYGYHDIKPYIASVVKDSPAAKAGIQAGDTIVRVNGFAVTGFFGLAQQIQDSAGRRLVMTYDRDGRLHRLVVRARSVAIKSLMGSGKKYEIGIMGSTLPKYQTYDRFGMVGSMGRASVEMESLVIDTLVTMDNVVSGRMSSSALSGPVKMVGFTGKVLSAEGPPALVLLTAVLSMSIGVFNLFPIPVLDGGTIALILFESVMGREISAWALEMYYRLGFGLIACLVILVTTNDLLSYMR